MIFGTIIAHIQSSDELQRYQTGFGHGQLKERFFNG